MPFVIPVTMDVDPVIYFEEYVEPAARSIVQSYAADMPELEGQEWIIRFSLGDDGSWDVVLARAEDDAPSVRVEPASEGPANMEIIADRHEFSYTQFEAPRQMQVLRLLEPSPKRLRMLREAAGETRLALRTPDGRDLDLQIIFNGVRTPMVSVEMAYDDFCDILEGERGAGWLLLTGRIRYRGSLPLLRAAGAILAP